MRAHLPRRGAFLAAVSYDRNPFGRQLLAPACPPIWPIEPADGAASSAKEGRVVSDWHLMEPIFRIPSIDSAAAEPKGARDTSDFHELGPLTDITRSYHLKHC